MSRKTCVGCGKTSVLVVNRNSLLFTAGVSFQNSIFYYSYDNDKNYNHDGDDDDDDPDDDVDVCVACVLLNIR